MKVLILLCVLVATVAAINQGKPCLSSAGYSWCESEGKCVRPWELAKEKNVHFNSGADFTQYCNGEKTVGSDQDSHGCVASAGYSWCAKENKCVKPWELATERALNFKSAEDFQAYCGNQTKTTVGGDADSHGCVASTGYSWCAKQNKCVKPWEITKGDQMAFEEACADCLASAGYSYCYFEQRCVRPWELAKQLSLDNTPEAIKAHCEQPRASIGGANPRPQIHAQVNIGGTSDEHNCINGAGYTWCQAEGKCVRPWELAKERSLDNTAEALNNYCNSSGFLTGPLIPSPGAPQNQ